MGGGCTSASRTEQPLLHPCRGRSPGTGGTTYHSGVSWARSLPGPLRRPLSRLVHAAWDGAAELGAIGPDDPWGRRFGRMGRGACLLFPQGAIYNEHLIHIGAETIVGPGASISAGMAPGQEMPTDPVVSIGSRCLIGRGSHIVGHWEIVIGDDIQTGPYVYITDQNHSYEDPVEPIGRQWPTEAAVRIGSGSWLGANAVILPGAQIGEHVVVAAGAVVRGEVPDRCVVAGVPARIVRRWVEGPAGSPRRTWRSREHAAGRAGAAPGVGERPGRAGHRGAAVRRAGRAGRGRRGRGAGARARAAAAVHRGGDAAGRGRRTRSPRWRAAWTPRASR